MSDGEEDDGAQAIAGVVYDGKTRGPNKHACPVADCQSRVKNLEKHVCKMHSDLSEEQFAEVFGVHPYNFLRCAVCHEYLTQKPALLENHHDKRHTPVEANVVAEQEGALQGAVLQVQPEQAGVGAHQGEAVDGEELDDEAVGADQAEPLQHGDAGYMKQPTLDTLSKANLILFMAVVVRLLKMALGEDDNAEVIFRAIRALHNLAGVIKEVEYRATGKTTKQQRASSGNNNRQKVVGKVLGQLTTTSRLLDEIEDLVDSMVARRARQTDLKHPHQRQVGLERSWDEIVERATVMVREGNLAAALALVEDWEAGLRGQEPHRSVAEVKELVAPYFRSGTEKDHVPTYAERCAGLPPEDIVAPKQLTEEQVLASMVSLPRGRAAGQSGWSNSLLKTMGLSEQRPAELVPLLTQWFNRTLRGLGGPAGLWTVGRAALLPKEGGSTRVLSIGESLVRFFLRTLAFATKERGAQVLAPNQFSVGVPGGVDQLAQAMGLAARGIYPGSGLAIAAKDIENAFPSVERGAVADAVWDKMPELYPLFEWLYGEPSVLVLKTGEVVADIETGLRMGCPLAVLLFGLAIAAVLELVANAKPGVRLMYFADDGTIFGECGAVKAAILLLVEGLLAIGLKCHQGKSVYYDGQLVAEGAREVMGSLPSGEEVSFKHADGAKIVGRAIGSNAFVEATYTKMLNKHKRGLGLLHQLPPDAALVLLLYCVNARPMFLARNCAPAEVGDHLVDFDHAVDQCLAKILQTPAADFEAAWWISRLRALPVDFGGIAMPRLAVINEAAHTACLVEALVALKRRYGPAAVVPLREALTWEERDNISHYLPFLVEDGVVRLPGEASSRIELVGPTDAGVAFVQEMARVRQSSLARQLAKEEHKRLHEDLLAGHEWQRAAMVLSTHPERQLGRWIGGGLFLNMHNRLSTRDYLQALRLRLLVLEYTSLPNYVCGCRQKVNVMRNFPHLASCEVAAKMIQLRHDKVVELVAEFCKKCVGDGGAVATEVELPGHGEYRASRMDLVASDGLGNRVLVDVAIVNTSATSKVVGKPHELLLVNRRGAAFEPGYAATDREGWKRTAAAGALEPNQMADFKPFVVELTGRLGGAARDLLKQMELCHNTRLGDTGPAAFRKLRVKFFLELGMVLARGNAKILEVARDKIRRRVVAGPGPPAVGGAVQGEAAVGALGVDYERDDDLAGGDPVGIPGNEARVDGNEADNENNLFNNVALDTGASGPPVG